WQGGRGRRVRCGRRDPGCWPTTGGRRSAPQPTWSRRGPGRDAVALDEGPDRFFADPEVRPDLDDVVQFACFDQLEELALADAEDGADLLAGQVAVGGGQRSFAHEFSLPWGGGGWPDVRSL